MTSFLKKGVGKKIRFYLGYAGWGDQQLENEMKEKSWLTIAASSSLVLNTPSDQVWKEAVKTLGNEFLPIINYPLDPSYN